MIATATAERRAPTRQRNYVQAIHEAQREEMERDPRVILLGEDIRANVFGTAGGFVEAFGPERVRDTPISENGFVGAAVGAAMTGLRPIVDLAIATYVYVSMDQLVSQAAKNRYMFGGQGSIPLVVRAAMFYGGANAAHHSDRPHAMLMNVPGLKIIAPTTPYDVKGLLKTAIRTDDPVLCFEDKTLWSTRGPVPAEEYLIPLGLADVKREGRDVTIVAIAGAVRHALAAAALLAEDGVEVEVVDPRSLVPMDWETILPSVAKTGRLVVVDPAHRTCSAAAEVAATVAEQGFASLRAPIVRVTTPDIQIPFSPAMEQPLFPDAAKVEAAVRRVLAA